MKNHQKRLLMLLLMTFVVLCAFSQKRTYDNTKEGLSLVYPTNFKKATVQSAKHMLLKLEKGNTTIALSKWNYGIDESYTIWDDEIVSMTRENVTKTGSTLVSLHKRYVSTNYGKKKALVIITNVSNVNLHVVTYQFLHKGNLVQIVISNIGKYNNKYQSIYDSYVSGLALY